MKSNFLCILLRAAIPFLNVMNVQKRRHFYCETHTHTDKQSYSTKAWGDVQKKFNLIIIIIPNFLACECLFLLTAEMEVILAIIILLCTTFQRYCRDRRDCKLLFSPIAHCHSSWYADEWQALARFFPPLLLWGTVSAVFMRLLNKKYSHLNISLFANGKINSPELHIILYIWRLYFIPCIGT